MPVTWNSGSTTSAQRVVSHVVPMRDGHGAVHDAAVPVHAALGLASRARGVADQRQIVGPGRVRRRRVRLLEHFVPVSDLRLLRNCMRGAASASGSTDGRFIASVVGVAGDDGVLHRLALALRSEKGSTRGCSSCAVMIVVAPASCSRCSSSPVVFMQLIGHDHGVGAQDAVVRDHELRAVVHEQRHAVAASHAAFLLQEARERLALGMEFAVVGRRHRRRAGRGGSGSASPKPRGCTRARFRER